MVLHTPSGRRALSRGNTSSVHRMQFRAVLSPSLVAKISTLWWHCPRCRGSSDAPGRHWSLRKAQVQNDTDTTTLQSEPVHTQVSLPLLLQVLQRYQKLWDTWTSLTAGSQRHLGREFHFKKQQFFSPISVQLQGCVAAETYQCSRRYKLKGNKCHVHCLHLYIILILPFN